jgi:hypothetical protein
VADPRFNQRDDHRLVARYLDPNLTGHMLEPGDTEYALTEAANVWGVNLNMLVQTPRSFIVSVHDHTGETSRYTERGHRTLGTFIRRRVSPDPDAQPSNVFAGDRPEHQDIARDADNNLVPPDFFRGLARTVLQPLYDGTMATMPLNVKKALAVLKREGWLKWGPDDWGKELQFRLPDLFKSSVRSPIVDHTPNKPVCLAGLSKRQFWRQLQQAYDIERPHAMRVAEEHHKAELVHLLDGRQVPRRPIRAPKTASYIGGEASVRASTKRYEKFRAEYHAARYTFGKTANK